MAKKADDQAKAADAKPVDAKKTAAVADAAPATTGNAPAPDVPAPADPAPATDLQNPSGAMMEPEVAKAVDLMNESVDANPRAGTTSTQNATDWNDAKRARPQDDDFSGQGLDRSVYGKSARG